MLWSGLLLSNSDWDTIQQGKEASLQNIQASQAEKPTGHMVWSPMTSGRKWKWGLNQVPGESFWGPSVRKWNENTGAGLWLHTFCSLHLEYPSLIFCLHNCYPPPKTWFSYHLPWNDFRDIPPLYTLTHSCSHTQRLRDKSLSGIHTVLYLSLFWPSPQCIAIVFPIRLVVSGGWDYLLPVLAQGSRHGQKSVKVSFFFLLPFPVSIPFSFLLCFPLSLSPTLQTCFTPPFLLPSTGSELPPPFPIFSRSA